MNPVTIWAIALKDVRQFVRDRTLLFFILLLPVLQLVLLAHATATGIRNIPIAVIDDDRSRQSRALIALLDASERFRVTFYPQTMVEAERALERGEIFAVLSIPRGTAAALHRTTEPATIPLTIDATSSIAARVIESGAQQVLQRFVQQQADVGRVGIDVNSVMLYNPSMEGRPHTISAQLGFINYQITLGVAALGLAREREIGTLEQLLVTPIRRVELLIGKAIPPALIGILNFLVLTLIIRHGFNIPIRGAFGFLLLGSLIFVLVEVTWGIMISSLAGTQQQAILLVFMQAMIDVAFSGYLVPVRDMPGLFRFLAQFVPLNYYLIFVRSVILKGAGIMDMWSQLVTLIGLGMVIGGIATFAITRNLE